MSVTCHFNGRLGNIVYNLATMVAYCKKHKLQYHVPTHAWACENGIPTITIPSTGEQPINPQIYNEPVDSGGHPYYQEIPAMDNVLFKGYFQSFRYFQDYRQDILDAFNLPNSIELGITALHIRRGDCVAQLDAFPMAPMEYYNKAIEYMQQKGFNTFRVYSDDISWCKKQFIPSNFPGAQFEFSEGNTELQDYISMKNCQNQITARSTFSLTAAWMNEYTGKICICPNGDMWWKFQNRDLLTGTENWLTQIYW